MEVLGFLRRLLVFGKKKKTNVVDERKRVIAEIVVFEYIASTSISFKFRTYKDITSKNN